MRVVILGESPVDQAAVGILARAVLPTLEIVKDHAIQFPRGWPGLLQTLPGILRALHFNYPHVEGVITVADADHSPIHMRREGQAAEHIRSVSFGSRETCRVCDLRSAVQRTLGPLPITPHRQEPLRVALGLAVPALEAWLLCGRSDIGPSTSKWITGHTTGRYEYTKSKLKRDAYGSDRASEATMLPAATDAACRLSLDIEMLRTCFPHGFGMLVDDLQGSTQRS